MLLTDKKKISYYPLTSNWDEKKKDFMISSFFFFLSNLMFYNLNQLRFSIL